MVKVNVYGIDGASKEKVNLPKLFETPFRPDIIHKSFSSLSSNKRQAYGPYRRAGAQHATASVGKGRGMSRVPRLTQGRSAALAPVLLVDEELILQHRIKTGMKRSIKKKKESHASLHLQQLLIKKS